MINPRAAVLRLLGVTLLSSLSLGCATHSGQKPARLAATDAATMTAVRTALSAAMGRTRIDLGPEDMAVSTTISVLPPPLGLYDTRSLAVPTLFDIRMDGRTCILVARSDGKIYPLRGVTCRAVEAR
jgi:hypothetical protein